MVAIEKSNIAILTTVANFDLYKKTSSLFPSGIRKFVIDGTKGMHGLDSLFYMMKVLKKKNIKWLIMADEDVIFTNPNTVFLLIKEMQRKDITVCGIRDGGIVTHRVQNPWVINTFFSILNFEEIEKIWNITEVSTNQYILNNEFDDDLSKLVGKYNTSSLYEPYYCFYLWLRRKGKKTLFLDAKMHTDGISNKVLYKDDVFLHHTWYARSYGQNIKHTKRINAIFNKVDISFKKYNNNQITVFKDKSYPLKKLMNKIIKKIVG